MKALSLPNLSLPKLGGIDLAAVSVLVAAAAAFVGRFYLDPGPVQAALLLGSAAAVLVVFGGLGTAAWWLSRDGAR